MFPIKGEDDVAELMMSRERRDFNCSLIFV